VAGFSDQGEKLSATDRSSRNLGTTTENEQSHDVIRKFHGRTAYLRADSLFAGLSKSLSQYPEVAKLVGVEETKTEKDDLLERIRKMGEADRKALMDALGTTPKGKRKQTG
jgi:hypothetical protein